jgi:ABC-type multidrug transport system fused ATPase/permease subunit
MAVGPAKATPFLWKLRPYFRQVSGLLVLGSISGILMNVAIVLPAVFLGRAINTVLAYQQGKVSSGSVGRAAIGFVLATAATELPRIGKRWWLGLARTRFQANVRADALRGVLAWPMEQLAAMSVGGVMARVIGDVQVLGLGVGEVIVETWDTLLFSAALVVTMFIYSPTLAAAALIPVPFALLLAKAAGRWVAARTTHARQTDADLTSVLHEQLGAFRLLRLAGRSIAATGRVRLLADVQAKAELDAIRLESGLAAVYNTMLSAGVVVIFVIGGHQVASSALSVGGLVAFLQLFVRFTRRAPRIPQMANRIQAAGAAYVRLDPLLAAPPPLSGEPAYSSFRVAQVAGPDEAPAPPPADVTGAASLRFESARFSYSEAGRAAIHELDLDVPAGTLLAITGPVGSGKSALARLAAGIYPPDTGNVLIDDTPVAELAPAERVCRVGYLGQEPHLFSGTVRENVLLTTGGARDPSSEARLQESTEVAAFEFDLAVMPNGVATEIGELGVRVSGGQRQRIALARALAAGGGIPGLLVLDDPFSAVDVHTEATIAAALRTAFGRQATIVLCSHRLAAFPYADKVVVLDNGRIEEQGTHVELLEAGGLYARIYRAQARLARAEDGR